MSIVEGMVPAGPRPIRVPYRFGCLPDGYFAEFQGGSRGINEPEIRKILNGLEFETLSDRSMWVPVS